MMSWKSDDLGVKTEILKLQSVFRDLYRYDAKHWEIPDDDPDLEVMEQVLDLVKSGNRPDNLLVFYYGGHAAASSHPGGPPIWTARYVFLALFLGLAYKDS